MIDRDYCSGIWDIGMFYEQLDVTRFVGRVSSRFGPSQLGSYGNNAYESFCVTAVLSHHDACLCQMRVHL